MMLSFISRSGDTRDLGWHPRVDAPGKKGARWENCLSGCSQVSRVHPSGDRMSSGLHPDLTLFSSPPIVSDFVPPQTATRQASLSFIISQSLLRLMSINSVMRSNHLILCHLLLLPSIFPSISVFSNELAFHIRRPKYWSFSLSISLFNERSGLISFRMDWLQYKKL